MVSLRLLDVCVFGIAPSMFGRDLVEQVHADSRNEDRLIPVIVEKCIDAVDNIGELPICIG